MSIPFAEIASALLARAESVVPEWLPAGKRRGHEWVTGDLYGGAGDSCSVNLVTGRWADFASDERGNDLISLYAAIHSIGQGEAAKRLAEDTGVDVSRPPPPRPVKAPEPVEPAVPGPLEPDCECWHPTYGSPTAIYRYLTADGQGVWCDVARYDPPEGRKQIVPWTWNGSQWRAKGLPAPRPLYNLHQIATYPDAKVMVVEGEKAAHAAAVILGSKWVVTTWMGGAQAYGKTDWSPLAGRSVTIWPDHDEPGRAAASGIAKILAGAGAAVRWLDTRGDDLPAGWDAADARSGGLEGSAFAAWARDRVKVWTGGEQQAPESPAPVPPDAREPQGATSEAQAGPSEGGEPPAAQRGGAESPPADDSKPTRRKGKPDLGIVDPVGNVVPVAPPLPPEVEPSAALAQAETDLSRNGKGEPHCNIDNAVRVLSCHPAWKDTIWFDGFRRRIMMTDSDGKAREWKDTDDIRLALWFQRAMGMAKMSVQTIADAVAARAIENTRDGLIEWLDSLKWDGQERLPHLMPDGFGADRNPYSEAVGRCFLVGMVARALRPGCKVDTMPVLEGSQGVGKTTALEVLGGEFYSEMHESITSKDFLQNLEGKWLVEIGELHSFRRAEVERIKGIITGRSDYYRPSYGRRASDHPRRCVFAGTTNRDDWVADDTGARRFLPITCKDVNLDWLKTHREQLFAEAVARFRRQESWWDLPAEDAKAEQEQRRQSDEWESVVRRYVTHKPTYGIGGEVSWAPRERILATTNVGDVLREAMQLPEGKWTRGEQLRVATALRLMGYIRSRKNGERCWIYKGDRIAAVSPPVVEGEQPEMF
ncbi:MAG: VapE domain-containing protein [Reyranella sp.]|uniref:VapE domain-containing protein n=1 Tax=Reyranella sp. TaxID=1929291 RepID=UPI003D113EF4